MLAFVLLNFSDFHPVYLSMHYAGHIFVVASIAVMIVCKPSKRREKTA
jgi:hypothetical protein